MRTLDLETIARELRAARERAIARRIRLNEGDGTCVVCGRPGITTEVLGWDREAGMPCWTWLCELHCEEIPARG